MMGDVLDQIGAVIQPRHGNQQMKLEDLIRRLREEVLPQVARLDATDQALLHGAFFFASAAVGQATTDEDIDVIVGDLRRASDGHQAVHGEPMENFIRKYYMHYHKQ